MMSQKSIGRRTGLFNLRAYWELSGPIVPFSVCPDELREPAGLMPNRDFEMMTHLAGGRPKFLPLDR
jgi:hypothetical protein